MEVEYSGITRRARDGRKKNEERGGASGELAEISPGGIAGSVWCLLDRKGLGRETFFGKCLEAIVNRVVGLFFSGVEVAGGLPVVGKVVSDDGGAVVGQRLRVDTVVCQGGRCGVGSGCCCPGRDGLSDGQSALR